jgi:hypothetical protein
MPAMRHDDCDLPLLRGGNLMRLARAAGKQPSHRPSR